MNKNEALRLALEALEGMYIKGFTMNDSPINKAITAVKAALEPKDEPVAWMNGWGDLFKNPDDAERGQTMQPLYTTPPQRTWVGLTAQETADCWTTNATKTWNNFEAKLKSKNT
jgi:hypothetical protein